MEIFPKLTNKTKIGSSNYTPSYLSRVQKYTSAKHYMNM